jgi:hypothetical protein
MSDLSKSAVTIKIGVSAYAGRVRTQEHNSAPDAPDRRISIKRQSNGCFSREIIKTARSALSAVVSVARPHDPIICLSISLINRSSSIAKIFKSHTCLRRNNRPTVDYALCMVEATKL